MVDKSDPAAPVIQELMLMMTLAGVSQESADVTFELMVRAYCMGCKSGVDMVFDHLGKASKKHAERN